MDSVKNLYNSITEANQMILQIEDAVENNILFFGDMYCSDDESIPDEIKKRSLDHAQELYYLMSKANKGHSKMDGRITNRVGVGFLGLLTGYTENRNKGNARN